MTSSNQPKLFAIFAFRYDAQLLPDLIQNLSFVDVFIIHDDLKNDKKWYHEGKLRTSLIEKARRAGADWVICVDPDERFEDSAAKKIRKLIQTNEKIIYGFPFRELWTKDAYRIDGVWGKKRKFILFPLKDGQDFDNMPVHSNWNPINDDYQQVMTKINLYHLKNIDPKNRTARAKLYSELDPERKFQKIGYDYLADEDGLILKKVGLMHKYSPQYSDSYHIRQHD